MQPSYGIQFWYYCTRVPKKRSTFQLGKVFGSNIKMAKGKEKAEENSTRYSVKWNKSVKLVLER